VTPIPRDDLSIPSNVDDPEAGPWVPADASLRDALAALLDGGTGWVAVRDGAAGNGGGRVLGVLTPTQIALAGAAEA
jgi:osmoprotectant transport system ATP-binding protein